MTVEDALEVLASATTRGLFETTQPNPWALGFVGNVSAYTRCDKPLSTEQAKIVLKLVSRYQDVLVSQYHAEAEALTALLAAPRYRHPPYPSANVPREVRHLGSNLLGFRFKRNDAILQDIKELRRGLDFGLTEQWYVPAHRLWVVPVTRETLEGVMQLIGNHRFAFDDAVAEYLTDASNASGINPRFEGDAGVAAIVGRVYDNEIIAWWTRDVLGGTPV